MKIKRTWPSANLSFTDYKYNEGVCAMAFREEAVRQRRPDSIKRNVSLLRHQSYPPSPVDWMEEVLYFMLTNRFSDGLESKNSLLERGNLAAAQARDQWRSLVLGQIGPS
jgi:hypothetical protein